ncbi:hypothetical protein JS565_12675 [Salmonella enterica subsp. enterica serovar Senftenberg]|nr:hypothetical protein [Salmonella enterica subsp. enterica serovar Senftenberg]
MMNGLSSLAREHIPASWCLLNWPGLSRWRGNTRVEKEAQLREAVYPAGAGNTGRQYR